MTLITRLARLSRPWALVIFVLCTPAVLAQAQTKSNKGIDLVFLVDVSQSMKLPARGAQANDPERIRWDAVLLSMNLLTTEDRFLIIPFNEYAPAKLQGDGDVVNDKVFVPGELPSVLLNPETANIRKLVGSFIHTLNPGPVRDPKTEWNGDNGGTAILVALETAKTRLAKLPADPDRRRLVVLLTDGSEASKNKPAGLKGLESLYDKHHPEDNVENQRAYSDELMNDNRLKDWVNHYAAMNDSGPPLKVYTIGLGQPDPRLLTLMARTTGGHYKHVENNGQLIDVFRDLIWQLKGCWRKERPIGVGAASVEPEVDLMSEIHDLGVLYYSIQREGPRVYSALAGPDELAFAWKDKAGLLDGGLKGVHSQEQSYGYDYYENNGLAEGEKLYSTWKSSNTNRGLQFSKRTVRPVFTVSELEKATYNRLESIPIRVHMNMNNPGSRFKLSDFKLTAEFRKTEEAQDEERGKLLGNPQELLVDRRENNEFLRDLDLAGLASAGGASDGYTLWITARGKENAGETHSLSGYKLELPPVDVLVENRLELAPVGVVTVSNRDALKQKPVRLHSKDALKINRNMKDIVLQVDTKKPPVDKLGNPVEVLQAPVQGVLRANQVGELEGELILQLRENLPFGLYTGGELLVSAPSYPKMSPLPVRYEASIETIKIGFSRSPIQIMYNEGDRGPKRTEPIRAVLENNSPRADNQAVTVTIPAERQPFSEGELWLESKNSPGGKSRSLELAKPDDEFVVCFQPRENNLISYHEFELGLQIAAPVYEPRPEKVQLYHKAPILKFDKPDRVMLQRGDTRIEELKIGLAGLPGTKRQVRFQCRDANVKPDQAEPPTFRFGKFQNAKIKLEPLDELNLVAEAAEQTLRLKVTAPRDIACGDYTLLHGELTAALTEPKPLELTVSVNDLNLLDPDDHPIDVPMRFYQVTGRKEMVKTICVFAEYGSLDPDDIKVSEGEPFLNLDKIGVKPNLHLGPSLERKCEHKHKDKAGQSGVDISITFPGKEPSFEQYSGMLVVWSKKLRLKKAFGCVVQWVDLVAPPENAAAKPAKS